MQNIAVVLLTYGHPETIDLYLNNCLIYYNNNGVDIYVLDSSPNDATREVVAKYFAYSEGLYYRHLDSDFPGDEKMVYALRGLCLEREYEYILPIKDRSLFPAETWQKVQELAKESPDLIFLEVCRHPNKYRPESKSQYTNPIEFISDCGWIVTSWETCIVSTKLMDSLDWEELIEKYDLGGNNNFNQPLIMSLALLQKGTVDVRVLHEKEAHQMGITNVTSGWRHVIFDLWARRWPKAIRSLPDEFNDIKEKVIFDQTDIRALFGWATYMASLREQNVLNEEVWEWLRPIWPTLSSIPVEEMDCIVASDFMGAVKLMYTRLDICFENEDYKGIWKIFDQYEDMAPADLMVALYAGLYIDECERNKGIANGIFSEVYSSQEYLKRYNSMVELIKKFESDISKEEGLAAYKQLQRLHLTGESLSFIISANCENKDAVINNLESLWA